MIDSEFKRKVKDFVQKNREDIVADIKDLVSINSVQGSPEENAPYGRGPKKALEKILEIHQVFLVYQYGTLFVIINVGLIDF